MPPAGIDADIIAELLNVIVIIGIAEGHREKAVVAESIKS